MQIQISSPNTKRSGSCAMGAVLLQSNHKGTSPPPPRKHLPQVLRLLTSFAVASALPYPHVGNLPMPMNQGVWTLVTLVKLTLIQL